MYIAIDVGGTSTRISSNDSLDNLSIKDKVEYVNTHDFEKDYGRIIEEIKKTSNKIDAIGIGIPGDTGTDKKTVYSTSWNQEWENKPFVDMFSKEFNCPVLMDNDAVVAALGVATYGEGKDQEFEYVTWGTGIGGATITRKDGKLISTKLDWYEYFEDWEEKCGGKKIEANYGKSGDKLTEEDWIKLMSDFEEQLKIFIEKTKSNLIIFGGGISSKQKDRILQLQNKLHGVELRISSLGENTGLYGGFGLIKNNI